MRRRLCAQCGAELVPEGMVVPGAEPCPDCGATRLPVVEGQAVVQARPVEEAVEEVEVFTSNDGNTTYRQFRQGPFVFRQYTHQGNGGGWGCGCGCLLVVFMIYLMLRGFFSLFG